jgi:hypothetical protein
MARELTKAEIDAVNSVLERIALRLEANNNIKDAGALRAGKLCGVRKQLRDEPRDE